MPDRQRRMTPRVVLLGTIVVLLAVNLRPGASSVGPLMAEITGDLQMSQLLAGVFTALPGLSFAVFGAIAVGIAARLGLTTAIAVGACCIAVGLLIRPLTGDSILFLLLTLLAFAGMAIGNVLVPGFIKRHFPRRVGPVTAAYTTALATGAAVAVAASAPLAQGLPGRWRASLAIWGVTAAVAAAPWVWLAWQRRRADADAAGSPSSRQGDDERHTSAVGEAPGRSASMLLPLRSVKAWALALFFGAQATQAYVQFGWLAQMYRDGGLDQASAGLMGSLVAGLGIPASLLMPLLVDKVPDLRPFVMLLGALLVAGYWGVLVAPTTLPWVWAVCLGLAGAAFPLAIALITMRTREAHVTTSVSGFVQSVAYLLAGLGPFAIGVLHDVSGAWTWPLVALMISAVPFVVTGMVAGRPGYIDDELAQQAR